VKFLEVGIQGSGDGAADEAAVSLLS